MDWMYAYDPRAARVEHDPERWIPVSLGQARSVCPEIMLKNQILPDLLLDVELDAGAIDQPLDQGVAHGRAGSPDTPRNFRRIAQQADRAFRDHFRRRSITGITVAADRDTDLTAVGRERDEQKIVK